MAAQTPKKKGPSREMAALLALGGSNGRMSKRCAQRSPPRSPARGTGTGRATRQSLAACAPSPPTTAAQPGAFAQQARQSCSGGRCSDANCASTVPVDQGLCDDGASQVPHQVEGFRFVDAALFDQYLSEHTACPECTAAALRDQLRLFALYLEDKGVLSVAIHLKNYLSHVHRGDAAARAKQAVPGLKIVAEETAGLQSVFTVSCQGRGVQHQSRLFSSATVDAYSACGKFQKRGVKHAAINVRAVDAFLNIGRGANDLALVCAHLNMPVTLSGIKQTWQRVEKGVVGPGYEREADVSCAAAAAAVRVRNSSITEYQPLEPAAQWDDYFGTLIGCTTSFDGGWHKRKIGLNGGNSNGGVAKDYDCISGCVLTFSVMIRLCKKCQHYRSQHNLEEDALVPDHIRAEHDCRENHTGKTSKSMEAAAAVLNSKKVARYGLRIHARALDDDSVTRAWCGLESIYLPSCLRTRIWWADPTHRIKIWGNKFFDFANTRLDGEVEGDSRFTDNSAKHAKKMVAYALRQCIAEQTAKIENPADPTTQYDVDHLWKRMRQAKEHMFNRHTAEDSLVDMSCANCGDWCGALKGAMNTLTNEYKPTLTRKTISANGNCYGGETRGWLKGAALESRMDVIFNKLGSRKKLQESCHPFSSQRNESGNNMIAHKAPKDRTYSFSSSYSFRIAATVVQENGGMDAFVTVYQHQFNIEPGNYFRRYMAAADAAAGKRLENACTREAKTRRKYRRENANKQRLQMEAAEGKTYGAGIGITAVATAAASARCTGINSVPATNVCIDIGAAPAPSATTRHMPAISLATLALLQTTTDSDSEESDDVQESDLNYMVRQCVLELVQNVETVLSPEQRQTTTSKPRKQKQPKKVVNNGVAGACTCSATCQRGCPCKAAKQLCSGACKCDSCKCKNREGCSSPAASAATTPPPLQPNESVLPVATIYSGSLDDYVQLKPSSATSPGLLREALLTGMQAVVVFLDLETTGLSPYKHQIIQWAMKAAGVCMNGSKAEFPLTLLPSPSDQQQKSQYVLPGGAIPAHITELTGIDLDLLTEKEAVTQSDAAKGMLGFIRRCTGAKGHPVILAGHNIHKFDMPFIYRCVQAAGLDTYAELTKLNVVGIMDTKDVAKRAEWVEGAPENFQLGTLYSLQIGTEIVGYHGAEEDTDATIAIAITNELAESFSANANSLVVSMAQSVLRIRELTCAYNQRAPDAIQTDKISELRESMDRFKAVAVAGASLTVDFLEPVSDAQAAKFRAETYNYAKQLGLKPAKTAGRDYDYVTVTM